MTYTQEKIDAHKRLDEAIESLRKAYGCDEDKDIPTGHVLLISTIKFCEPDPDDPTADDLDTTAHIEFYSRRGQDPTLTYGIIQESVRHYNEVQTNYRPDDD